MTYSNHPTTFHIPKSSQLTEHDYRQFLDTSYQLLKDTSLYLAETETKEVLELSHLMPEVAETVLTIYISVNDAVCNKGLVSPFLPRHSHNIVFAFDPEIFPGNEQVPQGTTDARSIINGFQPPNETWPTHWTYVMINDPMVTYNDLWELEGYIDMIPAKFEDFTMITHPKDSRLCIFIDEAAFQHPVNQGRPYLKEARKRGDQRAYEFILPKGLEGETKDLVPVMLKQGEKLYVARPDFLPCDHCWNNIHPANKHYAVVNENSAVPLQLVVSKPPVKEPYRSTLIPPAGSADVTTDWFYRGKQLFREPIRKGHIQG